MTPSSSDRRVLSPVSVEKVTAPLSAAAVEAMTSAAGTVDVELDLATGQRGRRGRGALEALAAGVPDAGAVHVVNNGAAALALVTRVLARGDDGRDTVVIARGELVREPEVQLARRDADVGALQARQVDDLLHEIRQPYGLGLHAGREPGHCLGIVGGVLDGAPDRRPAREPQQVTAALEMLWADPALDGVALGAELVGPAALVVEVAGAAN